LRRRRRGGCLRGVHPQLGHPNLASDKRPLGTATLCIPYRFCPRPYLLLRLDERSLSPGQPIQSVWDSEALLPWLHNPILGRALIFGLNWWSAIYPPRRLPGPISLAQWSGTHDHRCMLPPHRRRIIQSPLYSGLCLSLPPHPAHPGIERLERSHQWSPASHHRDLYPGAQTRPGPPRIPQVARPPYSSSWHCATPLSSSRTSSCSPIVNPRPAKYAYFGTILPIGIWDRGVW
jgi:hypothetical protein